MTDYDEEDIDDQIPGPDDEPEEDFEDSELEDNESDDIDDGTGNTLSDGEEPQHYPAYEKAGQGQYIVKAGDCLLILSARKGFYWKTLWNHPDNKKLKDKRKNPRVLYPGDRITIPDKQIKEENATTDKRHRYRHLGIPMKVRMIMMDNQEPLANLSYKVNIEGAVQEGMTDDEGLVEFMVSTEDTTALLTIETEKGVKRYELALGELEPHDSIEGIQIRLNNLGFTAGTVDGNPGPVTRHAIKQFQMAHGLEPTGEPDEQTAKKIKDEHGL